MTAVGWDATDGLYRPATEGLSRHAADGLPAGPRSTGLSTGPAAQAVR